MEYLLISIIDNGLEFEIRSFDSGEDSNRRLVFHSRTFSESGVAHSLPYMNTGNNNNGNGGGTKIICTSNYICLVYYYTGHVYS